jgi:hypothetical protein
MTSGGARARSGPAPDPDSFRQDGRDWVTLPMTYSGPVPEFPLVNPTDRELELWTRLWGQGHAIMWLANSQEIDVALHCRVTASIEACEGEPTAALLGVRIRMGEDLGLTVGGAKKNGWLFAKPAAASGSTTEQSASKAATNVTDLFSGVKVRGA